MQSSKKTNNIGNNINEAYPFKKTIAMFFLLVHLASTSIVYAEEEKNKSKDNGYPIIRMFDSKQELDIEDDGMVIFDPDDCTREEPLKIDSSMNEQQKLAVYYNDMMTNGAKSQGTRNLINSIIGPLTKLEIKNDETIEDEARRICLRYYGGNDGEEKWDNVKDYVEPLYEVLKEECDSTLDCSEFDEKWLSSNNNGPKRSLIPNNINEALYVITYIVGYINENDPIDLVKGASQEKSDIEVKKLVLDVNHQ